MTDWTGYRRPPAWGDVMVGGAVTLVAIVLALQVMAIPPSPLYARVGPTAYPWFVTAILGITGVVLIVQGLLGGWEHDEAPGAFDPRGAAYMALGLLCSLVFIDGVEITWGGEPRTIVPKLGFILASSLMFVCVARAFGSAKPIRDVVIGFLICLAAYVGFDRVLGYRIGTGLVESLF